MSDLKPCPFCGHADIVEMVGVREDRGFVRMCGKCGVRQGSSGATREQAIAAWNTRTDAFKAGMLAAAEVVEVRSYDFRTGMAEKIRRLAQAIRDAAEKENKP